MKTTTLNIERLVSCRESQNISKIEVARRLGISQPAYLRYESGERHPSYPIIQSIAIALNTSVDYLTGVSESPAPDTFFIKKNEEPLLFELVDNYKKLNSSQQDRLLAFLRNINGHPIP